MKVLILNAKGNLTHQRYIIGRIYFFVIVGNGIWPKTIDI